MSRERAEQALREAGFVAWFDDECWVRKDRDRIVRGVTLGENTATMQVPLADLPALLAPRLTEEERAAVAMAQRIYNGSEVGDTLRNLLNRLGGGNVDAG